MKLALRCFPASIGKCHRYSVSAMLSASAQPELYTVDVRWAGGGEVTRGEWELQVNAPCVLERLAVVCEFYVGQRNDSH